MAEEAFQQADEIGLRLDGDHTGAERTPCPHPVARVRPDIEGQAARGNEGRVEAAQLRCPPRDRVVDRERARHAGCAAQARSQRDRVVWLGVMLDRGHQGGIVERMRLEYAARSPAGL